MPFGYGTYQRKAVTKVPDEPVVAVYLVLHHVSIMLRFTAVRVMLCAVLASRTVTPRLTTLVAKVVAVHAFGTTLLVYFGASTVARPLTIIFAVVRHQVTPLICSSMSDSSSNQSRPILVGISYTVAVGRDTVSLGGHNLFL